MTTLDQRLSVVQLGAWYSVDGEEPTPIETREEVEDITRMIREELEGGDPAAPSVWATEAEARAAQRGAA